MIKDLIKNKSIKERANIKGLEIAKLNFNGIYISTKFRVKIEILGNITAIEGGIQVFARAWRGNKQLGFGKDGSVDIERFNIYNPPVLIDDSTGKIIRKGGIDSITGEIEKDRVLKYDPAEAIRQVIAHNVTLVGKEETALLMEY